MKRIAYAEEWLTTDDRVADLVLEYAGELARHGTSDTVTIPVLDGEAVRHAQFLIGPASQIIVLETDEERPERFDTADAVAELQARFDALRAPRPVLTESDDDLPAQLPED
jgi:hypothetical protein